MKKMTTLMLVSILFSSAFAQVQDYYIDAVGLKGFSLKTKLKSIITRGHRDRGYSALYEIYFLSDADHFYDGDGTIVDMYSENPRGRDPYTFSKRKDRCGTYKVESDCFNREHIFPQGTFKKRYPMRSDFFHIFPTDGKVNNRRSNYPFGEVNNPSWTSLNGSKLGQNSFGSYRGKVFEPIDEFKGDVARALFYFATRYEDKIARWYHPMLSNNKHTAYKKWFIELLKKWHKLDPVSEHERTRNNYGYRFQGNRNPFIDHPEFVELIW